MITVPEPNSAPQRVVSLVPSFTESYFDLGFGKYIVGITDYCTQPEGIQEYIPQIGGPRNPRLDDILAIKPDLILASDEENPKELIQSLTQLGIPIWLKTPKTAKQAIQALWGIVDLYGDEFAAIKVRMIENSLGWCQLASENQNKRRYFCPIWHGKTKETDWWMTFNQETYPSDLLKMLGVENCFARRERRFPLEADIGLSQSENNQDRDSRYPRVTKEEILASSPEFILIPDEPFQFDDQEIEFLINALHGIPTINMESLIKIDGSLIFWYGTRLAKALMEFPVLLQEQI
jgi:iron complex transport system substrate-binding protein